MHYIGNRRPFGTHPVFVHAKLYQYFIYQSLLFFFVFCISSLTTFLIVLVMADRVLYRQLIGQWTGYVGNKGFSAHRSKYLQMSSWYEGQHISAGMEPG
jgi:hypothetical protein